MRTTERGAARLRRRQEGQPPKRHPLADTLGLLLAVHLSPANLSDRDGAVRAVATAGSATPAAAAAWADSGYRGAFLAWALARSKIAFEVVPSSAAQ